MLSDYMIISCSWHGATSARLWYTSCSYPKMCHNILCPLFQECCISCTLCCKFYCCGIAASCVATIVTAWMNHQNSGRKALAASILPGSFWYHFYCQSVILCVVFSYTNSILDNHSASFISFQWLPTFLPLLRGPQNES